MNHFFATRLFPIIIVMGLMITNSYAEETASAPSATSSTSLSQRNDNWAINQTRGGTVYAPVYSHTFVGEGNVQFNFTVTLSLRNTDQTNPISISRLDYYNSDGKLVKSYLEKDRVLQPMASMKVLIKESDTTGGEGASFLITWRSGFAVSQPIIESLMVGTRQQQGISFISRGVTISTVD